MVESQEDYCQRILREVQEFQAKQLEESKFRQEEAEEHHKKVEKLTSAVNIACNKFDRMKAAQS